MASGYYRLGRGFYSDEPAAIHLKTPTGGLRVADDKNRLASTSFEDWLAAPTRHLIAAGIPELASRVILLGLREPCGLGRTREKQFQEDLSPDLRRQSWWVGCITIVSSRRAECASRSWAGLTMLAWRSAP